MVMLTSAAGTRKSEAMLGIAVVRTVPSRNSMKKVAATSNASFGCHVLSLGAATSVRFDSVLMAPVRIKRYPALGSGCVSSIL
ncbi:hypothetical protein NicSoilE8_07180 [Arthrobacter sp. NicSoilE8]|nr:hypothetical protein NicSoilE8_07180 [Arthrobacter sp. NicSoilE8]